MRDVPSTRYGVTKYISRHSDKTIYEDTDMKSSDMFIQWLH